MVGLLETAFMERFKLHFIIIKQSFQNLFSRTDRDIRISDCYSVSQYISQMLMNS